MILRKPLAFLIKHFKFIHFILFIINIYLIYKTSSVLVFFNEYISSSSTNITTTNLAGVLITPYMYLAVFVMMLGSTLILSILKAKQKPVKFYFINIFVYILVLTVFVYDYTVLDRLQGSLLDIQILELARDLLMVSILGQNVSLVWLGVRAAGFDIKNFHFNENLDELEIEESDNEEFEINLDIDNNLYKRRFRKTKRFFTYVIKENKLLVTLFTLIILAVSLYIVYLNKGVYKETLEINQAFKTTEFVINAESSYYAETDIKGEEIEEKKGFVILRIQAKNTTNRSKTLNMGRFALIVNGKLYYHTYEYKDKFLDLGYSYMGEEIPREFESYILVFKIPAKAKGSSMTLKYADLNNKEIRINATPYNLTKERTFKDTELGTELVFKDSPLKDTTFVLTSYDIKKRFKVEYKHCYDEVCYDSYEYVSASASDNYSKVLLKLNGDVYISKDIRIMTLPTFYHLIRTFATIEYRIGGVNKEVTGKIKNVLPKKVELKQEHYIEVPSEIVNADMINIKFNVRNHIYRYRLK